MSDNSNAVAEALRTELPRLSRLQKKYVELRAADVTPVKALLEVYPYWSKKKVHLQRNEANRIERLPKVQLWLLYYQQIGQIAAACTKDQHMGELARLREFAIAHGQIAAGVQAEIMRGKVMGHYTEKVQIIHDLSPTQILDQIAQESPELAKALASQKKIRWSPKADVEDAKVIEHQIETQPGEHA